MKRKRDGSIDRRTFPKRVEVYRNLKHGLRALPLYSIRYKGKVICRSRRVLLSNVTFKVSEAGRQRVIKEGRKNVHAFVVGYLVGTEGVYGIDKNTKKDLPVKVTYNPYLSPAFKAYGGFTPFSLKGAGAVLLNERGMSACYVEEQ